MAQMDDPLPLVWIASHCAGCFWVVYSLEGPPGRITSMLGAENPSIAFRGSHRTRRGAVSWLWSPRGAGKTLTSL